ncbi:hypothetical protein F5050DRAFT_1138155 [Lentinula boryana]|uniref:Uncharacterized protein n=1 Tax=Lentinula boryana TaxID=40481 RepID=A0ABQ8QTJ0_9AGAR|nr:hypothetical protein F5050DRAFT_1138155 [Lentinula boryana]
MTLVQMAWALETMAQADEMPVCWLLMALKIAPPKKKITIDTLASKNQICPCMRYISCIQQKKDSFWSNSPCTYCFAGQSCTQAVCSTTNFLNSQLPYSHRLRSIVPSPVPDPTFPQYVFCCRQFLRSPWSLCCRQLSPYRV